MDAKLRTLRQHFRVPGFGKLPMQKCTPQPFGWPWVPNEEASSPCAGRANQAQPLGVVRQRIGIEAQLAHHLSFRLAHRRALFGLMIIPPTQVQGPVHDVQSQLPL